MFVFHSRSVLFYVHTNRRYRDAVKVSTVAPLGWTRPEIRRGLAQLERIARGVGAARSLLIDGLDANGRDTAAEIARATGSSTRSACRLRRVAAVVERVSGAGDLLANASESSEHLAALARIEDDNDAAELLGLAVVQSPED